MTVDVWQKTLTGSAKRLAVARSKEHALWIEHVALMDAAWNAGLSQTEIAKLTGVSKVRVGQILSKKRAGT